MSKAGTILKTKDYSKFQVYNYNRPINQGLVKRLVKSIEDMGFIEGNPVLVDKTMTIIDGQHRFTACMRLGIEVPYMITDVDPQKAIINLNANQKTWSMINYIHTWAESGIKCYQHLIDFEERRKFGITNCVYILFSGNFDGGDVHKIKAGHKFSINGNAEKMAAFIKDCDALPYYKTTHFIRAVVKLHQMADAKQIQKIKDGLISLKQQASRLHYLIAFENMVNKGVMVKNRVSFQSK